MLTGANTYTGGVTVTAGTFDVSADNNLGNAANAVTVNGGTLESYGDVHVGAGRHARRRGDQPGQRDDADAVGSC